MDLVTLALARKNTVVLNLSDYGISLAAMFMQGLSEYECENAQLNLDIAKAFCNNKRCIVCEESFALYAEVTTISPFGESHAESLGAPVCAGAFISFLIYNGQHIMLLVDFGLIGNGTGGYKTNVTLKTSVVS